MRKLLAVLVLLLAGSGVAWADGLQQVVGSTTTNPHWTVTVFNDAGSDLTSGSIVVWDNDDTEFDRSGYPYVTTATNNGSPWVAGVTLNNTCVDQSLCEIVVYGPAITRIAHSTAAAVEDTTVSTSTVGGQAGDWDGGANECSLGTAMELREAYTGSTTSLGVNNTPMWVFVNVSCED